MDRLAKAAGADPVAFRLRHMKDSPREAAALKLAAEKAGWGEKDLPADVHRVWPCTNPSGPTSLRSPTCG